MILTVFMLQDKNGVERAIMSFGRGMDLIEGKKPVEPNKYLIDAPAKLRVGGITLFLHKGDYLIETQIDA